MRYMLVNVSEGILQIDLHLPEKSHARKKLHRMGPDVALAIPKGESVDLLPHFNGSLEKTHSAIKFSRDVVNTIRPDKMVIYVCDDNGDKIDIDKLLSNEASKQPVPETQLVPPGRHEDITKPDIEIIAVIAIQDQFEAKKRGEANEPKSYKKYKREELLHMQKKELMKIAAKLGIVVDKNSIREELISIIAGA